MAKEFEYDVFGLVYSGELELNNYRGYNSKIVDPVFEIYDYRFRDYKPVLGRFTTLDPIRDSLNWYVYVNNDPVNFIDPLGLCDSDVHVDAISGTAPMLTPQEIAELHPSPETLLKQLGTFGNPYKLEGPTITGTGSPPRYVPKKFIDVAMSATLYYMGQMAEDAPGGGGIIPGPLPVLSTGAGFEGTIELTTLRPRSSETLTNWTLRIMRPSGQYTPGTGWPKYELKEESRKEVAEAIIKNYPDLMKRAIKESEPSCWQKFKETVFRILGF